MAILWDFFSVFPANAGMILQQEAFVNRMLCVPRECGDDPTCLGKLDCFVKCSPRMRG